MYIDHIPPPSPNHLIPTSPTLPVSAFPSLLTLFSVFISFKSQSLFVLLTLSGVWPSNEVWLTYEGFCLPWICTGIVVSVITTESSYAQLSCCVWKAMFYSVSLSLTISLTSVTHNDPFTFEGAGVKQILHLWLSIPQFLILWHLTVVRSLFLPLVLQKETPLMKFERWANLLV